MGKDLCLFSNESSCISHHLTSTNLAITVDEFNVSDTYCLVVVVIVDVVKGRITDASVALALITNAKKITKKDQEGLEITLAVFIL